MMKNKAQLDKIVSELSLVAIKRKSNKEDLFFVLRDYCLENMILLNRKDRTYCLNRLALKVKNAQKIDKTFVKLLGGKKVLLEADKCEMKSFKVLIEVRAYNEEDMREIVEQANDSQIEWWAMCGD